MTRFFALIWILVFVTGGHKASASLQPTKQGKLLEKGNAFYASDHFDKALVAYQSALKEAERVTDSVVMFKACFKIGVVHAKNGNMRFANDYLNRAQTIAFKMNEQLFVSDCYLALGNIANAKGDFKGGLKNFEDALTIVKNAGDSARMALCHNNLGVLYNSKKDVTRAKYFYELALAYDERQNNVENIVTGLANVGGCYIRLHQGEKAMEYLQKAIELSNNIHSPDLKQKIYEQFSSAWSEVGNYEKALQYYRMHAQLKDSIFNVASNKRIAELESRFEFEKKQKEIALLKSSNEKGKALLAASQQDVDRKNNLLWFALVIIIITLVFGFLFYRQFRQKEQMNRDLILKNEEILRQKKQLSENLAYTQKLRDALAHDLNHYMQLALSKQMNPHFIFNSLNSIQSYILQNDKLEANLYLSKFADLMRRVLENSQHESVTVKDELHTLELYIALEQKRFIRRFRFNLQVEKDLNLGYYLIPPLILQPYVENAIWHGLMHKEEEGVLEIKIGKENGNLIFTIHDNGVGREIAGKLRPGKNGEHISLGTSITAKRLELLNSLNKNSIVVEYTDLKDENGNPAGTSVLVSVPIMSAFKTTVTINN